MPSGIRFSAERVGDRGRGEEAGRTFNLEKLVINVKTDVALIEEMDLGVLSMPVYRHITAKEVGEVAVLIIMNKRIRVTVIVLLTDNNIGDPVFHRALSKVKV